MVREVDGAGGRDGDRVETASRVWFSGGTRPAVCATGLDLSLGWGRRQPATLLTANATIRTATRGVIIVKVIVEWLWETRKWLFARVAVQIGS